MSKYENKKIAVLGYGLEGKSLVGFLLAKNPAQISVIDEKNVELEAEHLNDKVEAVVGELPEYDFDQFDYIFRSPGINPNKIKASQEKVSTLLNLFFEEKVGKTICVTGTKGKSTTVLLIEQLLKTNSKTVFVAGNIGKSPLDLLDQLDENSFTVLELSSFQLMDFRGVPDYAVILPIFPDHLDYHEDEQEYNEAKRNIFKNSDQTIVFSAKANESLLANSTKEIIYFSDQENAEIGLAGENIKHGDTVLVGSARNFCIRHQIPLIDLVAAVALGSNLQLNLDLENIGNQFKKLPLRIELVGEVDGAKFYNDSASTNPISTLNAVSLIGSDMALILGGSSKGLALDDFAADLAKNSEIKKIYLFGAVKEELANVLGQAGFAGDLVSQDTLKEVFEKLDISGVANVIFSPAFASFDQYKNYKERGDDFNHLFSQFKCKDI